MCKRKRTGATASSSGHKDQLFTSPPSGTTLIATRHRLTAPFSRPLLFHSLFPSPNVHRSFLYDTLSFFLMVTHQDFHFHSTRFIKYCLSPHGQSDKNLKKLKNHALQLQRLYKTSYSVLEAHLQINILSRKPFLPARFYSYSFFW